MEVQRHVKGKGKFSISAMTYLRMRRGSRIGVVMMLTGWAIALLASMVPVESPKPFAIIGGTLFTVGRLMVVGITLHYGWLVAKANVAAWRERKKIS